MTAKERSGLPGHGCSGAKAGPMIETGGTGRDPMMDASERKAHWQQVYREKSPEEVSWYQPVPTPSLELVHRCGLSPDDPVIDVGGGTSTLADHLLREGFTDVTVLDVSAAALAAARRRLGNRADSVRWIEADVTTFVAERKYRLWHDRALFHFLTDAVDRRRYLDALGTALAPGGHLVLAAFAVGGPQRCSGLEIVQYDGPKLLSELGDRFRLIEQRREDHQTPAGGRQDFAWFHCVRGPATAERS